MTVAKTEFEIATSSVANLIVQYGPTIFELVGHSIWKQRIQDCDGKLVRLHLLSSRKHLHMAECTRCKAVFLATSDGCRSLDCSEPLRR